MADSWPIGLLDAVTGAVTGPVQCIQGQAIMSKPIGLFDMPIHVNAFLGGAAPTSCTVIIETCDTLAGSYTTWVTMALTAAAPHQEYTGKTAVRFIRARVSASSGTNAISAYLYRRG